MKHKIAWLAFALIGFVRANAQQDVQFSQYIFNGLTINPAYAGYKNDWYVQGQYRQQWVGFPGAPKTGGLSIDGLLGQKNDNMGIGGQIMFDKLGPQQALSIYGDYAYRIQLDEADTKRLSFGIGFGATQYSLDGTMLDPNDQLDNQLPVGKIAAWKPDARFGVYFYTPKYYVGAALLDLFSLNQEQKIYYSSGHEFASIKKATHLYVTAGTVFKLSDNVSLKPSFLWKEDFKGPSSVDINTFILLAQRLWIGGSYRTAVKLWNKEKLQPGLEMSNAASIMAEYYVTPSFRFGYSYDIATNGLAGYQGGTHEISIGIVMPRRGERVVSPRYF